MPSEVELIALQFKGIKHAKAIGRLNPITGQHVELIIEVSDRAISLIDLKDYLSKNLPKHMNPLKIIISEIVLSHRYKKL